jgi:hypothetical protein
MHMTGSTTCYKREDEHNRRENDTPPIILATLLVNRKPST